MKISNEQLAHIIRSVGHWRALQIIDCSTLADGWTANLWESAQRRRRRVVQDIERISQRMPPPPRPGMYGGELEMIMSQLDEIPCGFSGRINDVSTN